MREIIIAAGGKSEYKIAVPQNASQPEMFAARELQKYIDYRSYGNELEMQDRYLFTPSGVFRYQ